MSGGGHFRVEEYKKPEFEVKVEAPTEPVMLGEKIAATVKAKYYFGAPVTEGKVKYKVTRTSYSADWYPVCPWDWFYGRGYWWFACDYKWCPRLERVGLPAAQPGVVAGVAAAAAAGDRRRGRGARRQGRQVKVEIDTAIAKALYGDTDHKYEVTAEVTDQSRRTIVGDGPGAGGPQAVQGLRLGGPRPLPRGRRDPRQLQRPDAGRQARGGQGRAEAPAGDVRQGRPARGDARCRSGHLDTGEEGRATQQMKAAEAGQYRISYTVTDAKKHAIEGGYVFVVRGEGFDGSQFRFNDIELVTDKREYQPGEKVKLMVNTNRADAAVVLFLRPANGMYLPPKVLRLKGKSDGAGDRGHQEGHAELLRGGLHGQRRRRCSTRCAR